MKSKQCKTYQVGNKTLIFNTRLFQNLFLKQASENNLGIGKYEQQVADALYVDKSAIHNWRLGINSPSDIDKIQSLANLWNMNYETLLKEENVMNNTANKKLTDREKTALKNVYLSFLNYVNQFINTSGFIWNRDGSDFDIQIAYRLYEQTKYALEMEYIDLKGNVYDKLLNFYNRELTYTLEGYYSEEDGDYPELQKSEAEGLYEYLTDEFKEIIDPFLVE